jgi:hypothetical protein
MLEAGDTPEARAFISEQMRESANVAMDGNFSIQVLSAALERKFGITLEDTRRPENHNYMIRPDQCAGFVLNRSAHWYCMRKLDGQWWQMNSANPAPERMLGNDLARSLADLVSNNWTIFMVKPDPNRGMPAPISKSSGMGDPSNWVDPAHPPGGSAAFGNGFQKKEEPKFEAFKGGGNRLGGPPSGASAGAAATGAALEGKTEDEQLAMALALSSGLANKARLEGRLLPEPESGGARVLVRMPDGKRCQRKFPDDAPLSSLIDWVCVELCESGAAASSWKLASQYPPVKLTFSADATCDDDMRQQTIKSAGLAPSASLTLTAC